jgi:uncharacterized membrane protein YbhN (UPF0104 family)
VAGASSGVGAAASGYHGRKPVNVLKSPLHLLRRFWAEALAVASLVALVVGVNPLQLGHVFGHIRWQIALVMVPVVLVLYVCRGTAWWFALRGIGEHISFVNTQLIELAGQVMIILPMGDLSRVAMARSAKRGRGVGAITATVALQEILYMLLVSLGTLPRLTQHPGVALLMLATTIAFSSVFVVLLWKPAYERAIRLVEHVPFLKRFDEQLHEIRPAFVQLCRWRTLLPIIALQAIAALFSFLLFYLALLAIGLTHVSYIVAVFALGVSYTFGAVSFLPLGIGAFEGLLTVILLTLGIPAAAGAASALLYRGYNDVLMAIIGAPSLLYVRARQRSGQWRSDRTPMATAVTASD